MLTNIISKSAFESASFYYIALLFSNVSSRVTLRLKKVTLNYYTVKRGYNELYGTVDNLFAKTIHDIDITVKFYVVK